MEDPVIKAALEAARVNEPHFIEEQVRICEIPAPPFHEEVRGKEMERLFQVSRAYRRSVSIKPAT